MSLAVKYVFDPQGKPKLGKATIVQTSMPGLASVTEDWPLR